MSLQVMLVCAMHRAGKPETAADLHDRAVALAMDHDWPRSTYATWSPQKVAAAMRNLERNELAERADSVRVEGNERDRWRPKGFFQQWSTPSYPVPDAPTLENERHELDGMTRVQQLTAFEALGDVVAAAVRLRRNCESVLAKELADFDDTVARARRQIMSAGLVVSPAAKEPVA